MATYRVPLTGPQLRVLHECLAMVLNDSDWGDIMGQRDAATLERAHDVILDAWRTASRNETV